MVSTTKQVTKNVHNMYFGTGRFCSPLYTRLRHETLIFFAEMYSSLRQWWNGALQVKTSIQYSTSFVLFIYMLGNGHVLDFLLNPYMPAAQPNCPLELTTKLLKLFAFCESQFISRV